MYFPVPGIIGIAVSSVRLLIDSQSGPHDIAVRFLFLLCCTKLAAVFLLLTFIILDAINAEANAKVASKVKLRIIIEGLVSKKYNLFFNNCK